jgi:pimeloyl-ACP methyl ester carboxylesterase
MTAAVVAGQVGELIRAVILVDPTFLSAQRQREVRDSDVAEQHRRILAQTKDDVVADIRRRHPHRSPEIAVLMAEARLQTRLAAFDVLTPLNPEFRQLVREINVPSLLVIGDAPVVSLQVAHELQALNSHLRVEQVQNAGHGLPYDQPERLAAVVRSFLDTMGTL